MSLVKTGLPALLLLSACGSVLNSDKDTPDGTLTNTGSNSGQGVYDDCSNECPDTAGFHAFTNNQYYVGGDIAFSGFSMVCGGYPVSEIIYHDLDSFDVLLAEGEPTTQFEHVVVSSLIGDAAAMWDTATSYVLGISYPQNSSGAQSYDNTIEVIEFDPSGEIGVLGDATVRSEGSSLYMNVRIFEKTVEASGGTQDITWSLYGSPTSSSLYTILAHEIGHGVGLGHVMMTTAVPNVQIMSPVPGDNVTLHAVEDYAVQYLYPPSTSPLDAVTGIGCGQQNQQVY